MLSRIKSLFQREIPWQKEIQELWKELASTSGEAETLQGELVRCIQNLADEANRNGWMNWDSANEGEIEVLKKFLNDAKVFSAEECKLIQAKLDKIQYAGTKGADEGFFGYEEIKYIAERVVLWCRANRKLLYKAPEETWLDYPPLTETK